MHISEFEFETPENGGSAGIEEIAFFYGIEEIDDEEENRVRGGLIGDLGAAMETLSDDERFIINAKYVDGKSNTDIGRTLGFSREKVRRKHKKALQTLKTFLQEKGWSEIDVEELLSSPVDINIYRTTVRRPMSCSVIVDQIRPDLRKGDINSCICQVKDELKKYNRTPFHNVIINGLTNEYEKVAEHITNFIEEESEKIEMKTLT